MHFLQHEWHQQFLNLWALGYKNTLIFSKKGFKEATVVLRFNLNTKQYKVLLLKKRNY